MDALDTLNSNQVILVIFGVKHSGKSSIGRSLSRSLGWMFHDLDDCIEAETMRREGKSIRDFFRIEERQTFFDIEANCLARILQNQKQSLILATGGGIIDNDSALKHIPSHAVKIFLDSNPEVLFARIMKKGLPPFLSPDDPYNSFLEIHSSRTARYKQISDIIVDRNDSTIQESTDHLITLLKDYLNARK